MKRKKRIPKAVLEEYCEQIRWHKETLARHGIDHSSLHIASAIERTLRRCGYDTREVEK